MGKLVLKNRVVMAALTRARCNPYDGIPNELVAKYYAQRAGAAICIT
jgi:N-ethylmaleimide reductase